MASPIPQADYNERHSNEATSVSITLCAYTGIFVVGQTIPQRTTKKTADTGVELLTQ